MNGILKHGGELIKTLKLGAEYWSDEFRKNKEKNQEKRQEKQQKNFEERLQRLLSSLKQENTNDFNTFLNNTIVLHPPTGTYHLSRFLFTPFRSRLVFLYRGSKSISPQTVETIRQMCDGKLRIREIEKI